MTSAAYRPGTSLLSVAEHRVYGELEALKELVESDALDKDELRAAAWVLIERVNGLREDLRRLERARAAWQREAHRGS